MAARKSTKGTGARTKAAREKNSGKIVAGPTGHKKSRGPQSDDDSPGILRKVAAKLSRKKRS